MSALARLWAAFRKYDPDQPRAEDGKWTSGGGSSPPSDEDAERAMLGVSEPNGKAPAVSWGNQDLQDSGKRVDEDSIRRDYADPKDKYEPVVYRAYVSLAALDERLVEEEADEEPGGYSWDEFDRRGTFPPAKIAVHGDAESVSVDILDGNHRVRFWREAGFDEAPVWVLDYRPAVGAKRRVRKSLPPLGVHAYVRKAKSRSAANAIHAALKKLEPEVAAAFRAAAGRIRDRATLRAIAAALEAGDLERALEVAGAASLGPQLLGDGVPPGQRSARDALISSLVAGGEAGLAQLPREAALRASLDLTNPEAVRYLRERVPDLVREVSAEQREALRQAAYRGMTEGRPIPLIAREMREAIGLTRAMQTYVANFRRQLETGQLGAGTAPWDRRLSAAERQQSRSVFLAGGERSARVDALVARYSESLLNRRSENIARTETARAFREGQRELWRQAEASGLLDPSRVRRVWVVTPDDRLRDDHRAVPGMNPDGVGLSEPFQTPVGPVMEPGTSGDPAFDINCRCTVALEFDEPAAKGLSLVVKRTSQSQGYN